jgi:hypothetical protein
MTSLEPQQAAELVGWLRNARSHHTDHATQYTFCCLNRRRSAGLAALAMWCCLTDTVNARTENPKLSQQSPAPFKTYASGGKAPSAAVDLASCVKHEIVAISTQMIAIVTRTGDTLENLQACYSFDPRRTNAENELLTDTLRAGQIILLFK